MPCSRTGGPRPPQGFTLLEAIVAMVIMATTLLALYAWLGSNAIAVRRAQAVSQGLGDARVALEVVEGINPMSEDRGSREVGPLTVRWTATPLGDRRTGTTPAGSAAPYDYTLYDVHVEALRDGLVTYAFNVRRAGWVATRTLDMDDF